MLAKCVCYYLQISQHMGSNSLPAYAIPFPITFVRSYRPASAQRFGTTEVVESLNKLLNRLFAHNNRRKTTAIGRADRSHCAVCVQVNGLIRFKFRTFRKETRAVPFRRHFRTEIVLGKHTHTLDSLTFVRESASNDIMGNVFFLQIVNWKTCRFEVNGIPYNVKYK